MKILLVGGTGLIGSSLKRELIDRGHSVHILSRKESNDIQTYLWNINDGFIDLKAFEGISGVINLTGANIAGKRWSEKRKEVLYNSRIDSTRLLYEIIKKNNIKIDFFINASAIGYYGVSNSNIEFTEKDPSGKDFLAKLCEDWEFEALKFNDLNVRTVLIRTGIVLTKSGGALEKMKLPINFRVLPIFGNGKQYIAWIHIDDLVSIFNTAINNKKLIGPYNAVAPEYSTYKEFNYKISEVLKKKSIPIKIPTFLLNLIFGELAQTLTSGNKISSGKIREENFKFQYSNLQNALSNLLLNKRK